MLRAKLSVVAGAVLFSTGGVAVKLSTLSGWQVSCLRSVVAAGLLLVVLPRIGAAWTWRSWAVAVPYAATFTLYTLANKLTTAANAIFLQDTAPLYILLLGPLLLRERTRAAEVAFMAALVVGLGMIFVARSEPSASAADPARGDILGACSGLSWALTVMGMRWLAVRSRAHAEDPLTAVAAGCILASLVGAIFAFPVDGLGPWNWALIVYLGAFQIALAYLLVTSGIRHVSALQASLLLLVEPVLAPLWAWLALAEVPGPLALAGGAVVISATVAYTARDAHEPVHGGPTPG